ncbi:hypothetical protein Lal_00035275 [Lupinus albus]|nr:hypothetical protein Lal_00035275 [Lupinus albus]
MEYNESQPLKNDEPKDIFVVTENIRMKEHYCSKQGFKNNEIQGEVAYERVDSRTGCEAMEGQCKITKLVLDHNHEFA